MPILIILTVEGIVVIFVSFIANIIDILFNVELVLLTDNDDVFVYV